MKHGQEWFDGNFEPILSPALFEAVQRIVSGKARPRHRKIKHDFPLVGLFRCGECDGMISAQWATGKSGGRYRYYRCSKKRVRCTQPYVQESELADKIRARLQTISLCDRYTDYMLKLVDESDKEAKTATQSEIHHLSSRIKADEERMEKLVSAYLDGDIPKEAYLKRKDSLMRSLAALREELKDGERGRKNRVEPLREWILDLKQANFLSRSDDLRAIRRFVLKVGTNPTVSAKSPHFAAPAPSEFAASRLGFPAAPFGASLFDAPLTADEVYICGDDWRNFEPISRPRTTVSFNRIDRIVRELRRIHKENPAYFDVPAFAQKVY